MSTRTKIHDRVLHASNSEELAEIYGEWATDYEQDLVAEQDYVAPRLATEMLLEALADHAAPILDAGCGTGLVGQHLHAAGCASVDGVDYSPRMLDLARAKGIYRSLAEADLNARLAMAADSYSACICVGTLTLAHVGPGAIEEMARVVAAGGLLCFTVRSEAWASDDYAAALETLMARGVLQQLERRTADYIRKEGSTCELCLFRVC